MIPYAVPSARKALSEMAVRTNPGTTSVTPTPLRLNSARRLAAMTPRALFDALYMPRSGVGAYPAKLETKAMRPPPEAANRRPSLRATVTALRKFTASTRSTTASLDSRSAARWLTPAA